MHSPHAIALRKLFSRKTLPRRGCTLARIVLCNVAGIAAAALYLLAVAPGAKADEDTFLPKLRIGEEAFFEVYGQLNKGFLLYDDGDGALLFPLVDNSNSSTRFGWRAGAPVTGSIDVGVNFEFQWTPYSTGTVNRANRTDPSFAKDETTLLRNYEAWVDSGTLGKLSVGQGSMASDGTAEADLSGTNVVAYSSVGDLAGGQFLRANGTASTVQIKDAFGNLDGLARRLRVRYDTPGFAGFSAGASFGTTIVRDRLHDTLWDVSLRYRGEIGGVRVVGAAAYAQANDTNDDLFSGSFSALHSSGFNLTFAGGHQDKDGVAANPGYGYAKLGYSYRFLDAGESAFAIDYYRGEDFANNGSTSQSFGATVVQNLDYYRTEVYLGFRLYNYDVPGTNYEDGWGVLTGARIRF